jgi:heptosyltransferase II
MRILVIRLTALGDVVLTEPILRALRLRYPEAKIDFVTEARYQPLVAELFGVDSATGYDRRGLDRGAAGLKRVRARLPVQSYSLVIDLQGKLRTRALAALIPAEQRLVLRKRRGMKSVLALLGHDPPIHDRHAAEVYLTALEPLSLDPSTFDPRPILKRPERSIARAAGETLIGLSPGATHATKRWPIARFAELADRLASGNENARFVLIGGESDRAQLDELRAAAKHARFDPHDVAALDVYGLARAVASLDLLISVDTGPAHLAAAFGVRVVAIFGPTSTTRWGPRGAEHRVVSLELDCAPCSNMGDEHCPRPDRGHACMRELDVDRVLAAIGSRIGSGNGGDQGSGSGGGRGSGSGGERGGGSGGEHGGGSSSAR